MSASTYGATAGGVEDDSGALQGAIDACPSGGIVFVPAGTYLVRSEVVLKSAMSVEGAGEGQTILTMPAQSSGANVLRGSDISDVAIRDLSVTSQASTDNVLAFHFWNVSHVSVERAETINCFNGIKVDTSASSLTVADWTSRGDWVPLYVSDLTNGVFQRLDIADSTKCSVYIASSNRQLSFNDVAVRDAGAWGIQLWYDSGWETPSTDIDFSDLTIAGDAPLVIGAGYRNVKVSRLKVTSSGSECVRLMDPQNVVIDGFACSGGPYMLGTYDGMTDRAVGVTLRNGTYAGSVLVAPGAAIDGLTVENVSPPAG